jgi:hypothetical protein
LDQFFSAELPKREASKRKAKENSTKLMEKFLHDEEDEDERLLADLSDSDDDSTWKPSKEKDSTPSSRGSLAKFKYSFVSF